VAGIIFLVISIVGILLLPVFIPLMLLALAAALVVGFAAVAQRVGALVADRFDWALSRVPRIAIGAIAIYAISFLGWLLSQLPWMGIIGGGTSFIGWAIVFIAWTVGLGALLLALFDPPQDEASASTSAGEEPQAPPPTLPIDDAAEGIVDAVEADESPDTSG